MVLPADTEQVQAVVRACAAAGVPIVPRGAGSGLSGAANAIDGCVVLVTTRMNEIVEIDPDNRLAVVQPGVVNLDLRGAVEKHGLFYPPDPSSYDWCTIGGNLSTNAGGLCCVKYGVTTDSVLGLEVVLADGELLRTGRRTVKGVAGYDLTKLFIGSEGTLGVITQATLALRPLPQAPGTMVAAFSSVATAGEAVSRIVREGIVPSLMEIMDATSIEAVEAHLKTELGAGEGCAALLLCQSDSGGEAARRELTAIEQVCTDVGADLVHTTFDPAEGQMLLTARRAVLTALEVYGAWMTDDVCVPQDPDRRADRRVRADQRRGEPAGRGRRPRRRRQHAPDDRLRRLVGGGVRARQHGVQRHPGRGPRARRHGHRRARHRQDQAGMAGTRDRPGRHAHAPRDQGRAGPGQRVQPGVDVLDVGLR